MYAICRIGKLKGDKVGAADAHNLRLSEVKNADPDGKFQRIYGDKNLSLKEKIVKEISSGASIRKDGVEAVEMVLSASPDYFRPGSPGEWGKYEKDKMQAWAVATRKFLYEKYGSQLASIDLHCDEATPHIHAMIIPVIEKTKSARRSKAQIDAGEPARTYQKKVFDADSLFNPITLRQLQDDYAAAVKPLGLSRGISGSKAKHERIQRFYASLDSESVPTVTPAMAEIYRKRSMRAVAQAAEYKGLPKPAEMKARIEKADKALDQVSTAEVRAGKAERELMLLKQDQDALVAEAVAKALPEAVVTALKDPSRRQELVRQQGLER